MTANRLFKYFLAILICEGVGILGSYYTFTEIPTWYVSLSKPSFSPPNYLFGPVWTTLYALMGISIVLILEKKISKKKKKMVLFLFGVQLF